MVGASAVTVIGSNIRSWHTVQTVEADNGKIWPRTSHKVQLKQWDTSGGTKLVPASIKIAANAGLIADRDIFSDSQNTIKEVNPENNREAGRGKPYILVIQLRSNRQVMTVSPSAGNMPFLKCRAAKEGQLKCINRLEMVSNVACRCPVTQARARQKVFVTTDTRKDRT